MKKFLLMLLLSCAVQAQAQRFFHVVPKPEGDKRELMFQTVEPDSVRNEMRPVMEVSTYGFPGGILLVGGGFSYQHLEFIKNRWRVIWSVSALTWHNLKKVYSGLTFGFLNNYIMIGIAAHSKEIIGTLGVGINFNN